MKILILDIETSYIVGAVWGVYEQNVVSVLQDQYILGVGYAWNHLEGVHWKGLPDFPLYKKDKKSDKALVAHIVSLLDEADVVVAHNGIQFDIRKINGRILYHNIAQPSHYNVLDTKRIATQFGYHSRKLDELSRMLFGERKIKHDGIEMWTSCMADTYHEKAWKDMGKYCKQDVVLLKKLYDRMLGWTKNHPNWNIFRENGTNSCPKCGSGFLQKRGVKYSSLRKYQTYFCTSCRGWSSKDIIEQRTKTLKPI